MRRRAVYRHFSMPVRFRIGGSAPEQGGIGRYTHPGPSPLEVWEIEVGSITGASGSLATLRVGGRTYDLTATVPNALERWAPIHVRPGDTIEVEIDGMGPGETAEVMIEGSRRWVGR
jgi:hypothetical protein